MTFPDNKKKKAPFSSNKKDNIPSIYDNMSEQEIEEQHELFMKHDPEYRKSVENDPEFKSLYDNSPDKEKTDKEPDKDKGFTIFGRTPGEAFDDLIISGAKGLASSAEIIPGLIDLTVGRGHFGKLIEKTGYDFEKTIADLNKLYSDPQKEARREFEEAEGFWETVGSVVQNPSLVLHAAVESGPVMYGGSLLGKAGLKVMTKYAPKVVEKAGMKLARRLAAAGGEGLAMSGLVASDIRRQTDDGTLSLGQSGAAIGAGIVGGAIGYAGTRIAAKFGVADPDSLLLGLNEGLTTKHVAKRIITGGITEGVFEELPQEAQETIWVNAALGRPLSEGVGKAAAMGMFAGGFMGSSAQLVHITDTETPKPDPRLRILMEAIQNPDSPSIVLGQAMSEMTQTESRDILSNLNNTDNPDARKKAVESIEKAIIKKAKNPEEGRRRASLFANEAFEKIDAEEIIEFDKEVADYAAMPEHDQGEFVKDVMLSELDTALERATSNLENLTKFKIPTSKQQKRIDELRDDISELEKEREKLASWNPTEDFAPENKEQREKEREKERENKNVPTEEQVQQDAQEQGEAPNLDIENTLSADTESQAASAFTDEELDRIINNQNTESILHDNLSPENDRRQDLDTRKKVDEMTPEELRYFLKTSEKTGLKNSRAYKEAEKKKIQTAIDVDSLKWVNDNISHEAGDALLSAVGEAFKKSSLSDESYHVSGDEFVMQADTEAEIDSAIEEAQRYLDENEIVVKDANGTEFTFKGRFSHGKAETLAEADARLNEEKSKRELSGDRAGRGERPPGVLERKPRSESDSQENTKEPEIETAAQEEEQQDIKKPSTAGMSSELAFLTEYKHWIKTGKKEGEHPAPPAHLADRPSVLQNFMERAEAQAKEELQIEQLKDNQPDLTVSGQRKDLPDDPESFAYTVHKDGKKGYKVTITDKKNSTTKPVFGKAATAKDAYSNAVKDFKALKSKQQEPVSPKNEKTEPESVESEAVEKFAESLTVQEDSRRNDIGMDSLESEKREEVKNAYRKVAGELLKNIKERNFDGLISSLHSGNPESLKLFKKITGLPAKTQKQVRESLEKLDPEKYKEWQAQKEDKKVQKQKDKEKEAIKELEERPIVHNEKMMSFGEYIDALIDEGFSMEESKQGFADIVTLEKDGEKHLFRKKIEADYIREKYNKKVQKQDAEEAQHQQDNPEQYASQDELDHLFGKDKEGDSSPDENAETTQTDKIEASPEESTSQFGAKNKVYNKEGADKARENLRKKLNQMNTGLDPEMVRDGIYLAGFYIEGGARSFKDYTAKMVQDFGKAISPYLRQFYEAIRYAPELDSKGMTAASEIDSINIDELVESVLNEGQAEPAPLKAEAGTSGAGAAVQVNKTKEWYHLTDAKFKDFDTEQDLRFGSHFGTKETLKKVAESTGKDKGKSTVIPVHLNIKNPLRLPDLQFWEEKKIAEELKKRGITVPAKEYMGAEFYTYKDIKKAIEEAGFDGVIYDNLYEGGGDSIIAFHPEQIKRLEEKDSAAVQVDPKTPEGVAYKRFKDGKGFENITEARKYIGETLGKKYTPGTIEMKQIDEQIEIAAVKVAREIVAEGKSQEETFEALVDLQNRMPNLSVRTSSSVQNQAYSTQLPLAYVAAELAGITDKDSVFEPAAGNGALLITANPENVLANEIHPDRVKALKEQNFKSVTQRDGSTLKTHKSYDVVIANPPFGTVKEDNGKSRQWMFSLDYTTTQIDHAMVLSSLKNMHPNGRAVFIIGSVNDRITTEKARKQLYRNKTKVAFFKELFDGYNVVDHFSVSGKLCSKQGASWPVDVIVIDGKGKSEMVLPGAKPPRYINSLEKLKGELNGKAKGRRSDSLDAKDSGRDGSTDAGNVDIQNNETDKDHGDQYVAMDDTAAPEPTGGQGGSSSVSGEQTGRPRTEDAVSGRPEDGDSGGQPDGSGVESESTRTTGSVESGRTGTKRDSDRDESGGRGNTPEPRLGDDGLKHKVPLKNADNKKAAAKDKTDAADNATQVKYEAASNSIEIGTLTPRNLHDPTQKALQKIKEKYGSVDQYVADQLGYTLEEVIGTKDKYGYFSSEQVDAIALALDNISKGSGFIIGDQTGVGKGRTVAAMIRYGIRNGITPIFVTDKPNLYTDMYRDLSDIGMADIADRILVTNSGETYLLTEDGSKKIRTKSNHNAKLKEITKEGSLPPEYDVVFTTYDQLNGTGTPRRQFLESIGTGGMFILDEAHKAGGSKGVKETAEKTPRSVWMRQMLYKAHSVFYSSATYAKRPDVMTLYHRTDMSLAVDDIEDLAGAIEQGGVPLQQATAAMLTEAGQYVRRERSFDGVTYETTEVKADMKTATQMSQCFAEIKSFSDGAATAALEHIADTLAVSGANAGGSNAASDAQLQTTGFTSVMHNLISQTLLAMKTPVAVEQAIEQYKAGKKPVLTLANTMGSFIESHAVENDLKPGDGINLQFNDLLYNYLKKTRTYYEGEGKQKITRWITDEELGPQGVKEYKRIKDLIYGMDFSNVPLSPIDYALSKFEEAGIKAGEITGRSHCITYKPDGTQLYRKRSEKEKNTAAKTKLLNDFNTDTVNALILNQSGSTGLSAHAIPKFKGHMPSERVMIILQAEANIDTHMQMLGRVHRAGQVIPPSYQQVTLDLPSERRPAAVLAGKMASLNANTTAAKKGTLEAGGVTDFINKYGDKVAANLMADFPDIHRKLGSPLNTSDKSESGLEEMGAAKKVTGRIPLLTTIKEQEELYNLLESEYKDLIEQLDALGQNDLEAKTYDTDAETKRKAIVYEGKGDSPFNSPAIAEEVDMKKIGRSYTGQEVVNLLRQEAFDLSPTDAKKSDKSLPEISESLENKRKEQKKEAIESFEVFLAESIEDMSTPEKAAATQHRLQTVRKEWSEIYEAFIPGEVMPYPINDEYKDCVVLEVKRKGKPLNPLALGTWKVKLAVPDSARKIEVSFNAIKKLSETEKQLLTGGRGTVTEGALNKFDRATSEARETRTIMTGNLLAAFGMFKKGRIINFTDKKGTVRQGILMPANFSLEEQVANKNVKMASVAEAKKTLQAGYGIKAPKGDVVITLANQGYKISVPASKAKGSIFYLNKELLQSIGGEFVKAGNRMTAFFNPNKLQSVLEILTRQGELDQKFYNIDPQFNKNIKELLGKRNIKFEDVAKNENAVKKELKREKEKDQGIKYPDGFYTAYDSNSPPVKVDGKKVTIPGYEMFEFFSHKKLSGEWAVTEKATGLNLATGETLKQTKELALKRLQENAPTPDKFKKLIKDRGGAIVDRLDSDLNKYQTTSDYTPAENISLKDIKKRFKNQSVLISKDGNISIKMKNGLGLQISAIDQFGENDTQLAVRSGRMSENGTILGKYKDGTITLNKEMADKGVLDHETYHFLADTVLTKAERAAILNKAKSYYKSGKFNYTWQESNEENEANAFAQLLSEREQHRGTLIGTIIQKIMDFIDNLMYLGRESARKMAKRTETGDIFTQPSKENSERTAAFFSGQLDRLAYDDALFAHNYVGKRAGRKLTEKEKEVMRLSYGIKGLNPEDLLLAATEMAETIPGDKSKAVLIPIPGHTGDTKVNTALANEISRLTGARVEDVLQREESPSQRELRVKGKKGQTPEEIKTSLKKEFTGAKNIYFVDNVITSGATIRAARNAVGKGQGLVYAKSNSKGPKYTFTSSTQEAPNETSFSTSVDKKDPLSVLPEHVRGRYQKSKGIEKTTLSDKLKTVGKKLKEDTKHFPALARVEDENERAVYKDMLRRHQDIPYAAQDRAVKAIHGFISDMDADEYNLYSLRLILGDEVANIKDGARTEANLPFGFKSTAELMESFEKTEDMVNANPKVKKAIEKRKKFQRNLAEQLVDKGLLGKKVLESNEYFHHQILQFWNMKEAEHKGTSVGSSDAKSHWRPWMAKRKDSPLDYNTEYVEAELTATAQMIAQINTVESLNKIKDRADIAKDLKEQARDQNFENVRKIFEDLAEKGSWPKDENGKAKDPFTDYNQKIAMGYGKLRTLAKKDLLDFDPGFENVVEHLRSGKEGEKHPQIFQFLTNQIDKGYAGAQAAATIYKNIKARDAFVKEVLGEKFKTDTDIMPKGYVKWEPQNNKGWFKVNSVSDRIIAQVTSGEKALSDSDVKQVYAKGVTPYWIIPEGLADTMDNFRLLPEKAQLGKLSSSIMSHWKQYILLNPLSVMKYNINNMTGDIDIVMAFDPKIMTYTKKSFNDVRRWMKHQKISELDEARDLGVIGSGFSIQEVEDTIQVLGVNGVLNDVMLHKKPKLAARYWSKTRGLTTLRENMLRLAAFRYFKDQHSKGIYETYGASNPKEIKALLEAGMEKEAAAKMARELLGDYGAISRHGEYLRRHLIPFYSWIEINAPRYVYLMRNLKHEKGAPKGTAFKVAGTLALRGSVFAFKANIMFGLVNLFNKLFFPDEDEELGGAGRRQQHLIIGRTKGGDIRTIRFEGALSDALSWFGAEDLYGDIQDIQDGSASIADKGIEAGKAFANKWIQGFRPDFKTAGEVLSGRAFYPDAFATRPIRDKLEHVLGTVKMQMPYEWLTGKPKKGNNVSSQLAEDLLKIITYTADPGVQAYYDTRSRVYDWNDKHGIESGGGGKPTKKGNALYYYKQALKYGDLKAADRYIKKYAELGGTYQGIKQSIRMAHPLSGIKKRDRAKFLNDLTAADKDRLKRAIKWYQKTYF